MFHLELVVSIAGSERRGVRLIVALLLLSSPTLLSADLTWTAAPGFRSVELTVPASGKTGFTLMAPGATGITFSNVLAQERSLTNQILLNGSGVAAGDVDGDGRLDFAVANQWDPSNFYRNRCTDSPDCGAHLGLHLRLPLQPGGATAHRPGHPGATPGEVFSVASSRPAVGATVSLRMADGRRFVQQADGGSGHSGRRSPDVFFGLGQVAADQPLDVTVNYRDPSGQVRHEEMKLNPGWHTVVLGWPNSGAAGK